MLRLPWGQGASPEADLALPLPLIFSVVFWPARTDSVRAGLFCYDFYIPA
jgi:hypothetical protein